MKTYLLIAALSSLLFVKASAQDDRKLRNDHTYSTHNYKHPNKAATARQWENKAGVGVSKPATNPGPVANYKHQVPGAVPAGGVVVPHTPEVDVSQRNYKIQRLSLSRPVIKETAKNTDQGTSQSTSDQ